MPFYNGIANSFADLRAALFSACVNEGWVQEDGDTISKGVAYVRATINNSSDSTLGPGIIMQGGTGLNDGDLVLPSTTRPRFGRPHPTIGVESWPMTYNIFIFNNPDEVFVVANFNVECYWWMAFGVSDNPGLPGTGLWLGATSRTGGGGGSGGGLAISSSGGGSQSTSSYSSGALFWQTRSDATIPSRTNNCTIQHSLNGRDWAGNVNAFGSTVIATDAFNAILPVSNLLDTQPNTYNAEAVLLPIHAFVWQSSQKSTPVVEVRNARYLRVDNYVPGQILTLGGDRWVIYPWYKKNSDNRNGGDGIDHSGTFGWAIKYDGV
jgi:hypothetical protein